MSILLHEVVDLAPSLDTLIHPWRLTMISRRLSLTSPVLFINLVCILLPSFLHHANTIIVSSQLFLRNSLCPGVIERHRQNHWRLAWGRRRNRFTGLRTGSNHRLAWRKRRNRRTGQIRLALRLNHHLAGLICHALELCSSSFPLFTLSQVIIMITIVSLIYCSFL